MPQADIVIIGAGAAGMAAAIFAGEAARDAGLRVALLDGAKKPGAKILVSGGGRCNVTNECVTPEDYWGGPRPLIRSVLRAFDEQRTRAWMASLGVPLKLEPTGKVFPVSDSARTVLDALLRRVAEVGVQLVARARVTEIAKTAEGFAVRIRDDGEEWRARRLIVAMGGLSLPKSGSDGWGIAAMRRLGHAIVPTTPALSPLMLRAGTGPGGRFADFSGITLDARLALLSPTGKILEERTGSTLFTHFGLSGPAPLDLSRHILRARLDDPAGAYRVTFGLPQFPRAEDADRWMLDQVKTHPRATVLRSLADILPERLARELSPAPGTWAEIARPHRLELARNLSALPIDVAGDRGYSFAETTAGGVDLREIDVRTMQSRRLDGLHLCGEMLDVDGRIGGFNFQWAWASGYLAGRAAVAGLTA